MVQIRQILKRLYENNVEHFVIGGVAAVMHGSPRVTLDVDICAPLSHENAVRIITALNDAHPHWRPRPDLPVITIDNPNLHGLKNMYLRTDLGLLDVLGEVPGIGRYDELKDRTVEMAFQHVQCRVLDLETLIAAKQFAGRDKDKPAVHELQAIQQALKQRANRDLNR